MSKREAPFRQETLDAFVDGELPADEAAAAPRRITEDPGLAEEVAALSRLRAGLRALELPSDLAEFDLDALLARAPLRTPSLRERVQRRALACTGAFWQPAGTALARLSAVVRRPGLLLRAAATTAALVLVLSFLPFSSLRDELLPGGREAEVLPIAEDAAPSRTAPLPAALPELPPYVSAPSSPFINAAISWHMAWVARPAGEVGGARLTAFARRHGRVYVPDLGVTGLRVVGTEDFGPDGVRVGYVGIHDCRISLFILPADVGPELLPPRRYARGPARLVYWRTHRLDYLLVAAGMDPTRFELVARAVIDATRALQPFGP